MHTKMRSHLAQRSTVFFFSAWELHCIYELIHADMPVRMWNLYICVCVSCYIHMYINSTHALTHILQSE